jgi:hypothetical protein
MIDGEKERNSSPSPWGGILTDSGSAVDGASGWERR